MTPSQYTTQHCENEAFISTRSRPMKQDLTPSRRVQRQRHIFHKRFIVLGLNAIEHLQHANEKEHCLRKCEFLCELKPIISLFRKIAQRRGRGRRRNDSRPIQSRGPPPKGTKAQPGLKPSSHRSGLNSLASSP